MPGLAGTRARGQQIQHDHQDHREHADVVGVNLWCCFEQLGRRHDEYGPRRQPGHPGAVRQIFDNPGLSPGGAIFRFSSALVSPPRPDGWVGYLIRR